MHGSCPAAAVRLAAVAVALPCIYIFNRAGQIEEKYNESPDHDKMDALVKKLLDQKGP